MKKTSKKRTGKKLSKKKVSKKVIVKRHSRTGRVILQKDPSMGVGVPKPKPPKK